MKTDKITSSYNKNLGEHQFVVDVLMQKSGEENISKILGANSEAYIDEIEMLNGEAHYSGAVVFNLLYVDENGENHVLSEKVDINGKVENDQITPLMKPFYSVEVVETKVDSADSDSAKVHSTINLKLNTFNTEEVEEVVVDDDSVEVNKEEVTVKTIVSNGTKTFELSEEYDTKSDVKKVLLTTYHLELKNVSAGTGYFTVEGNMFVNSLLEVQTEEGLTLKNFMQTIPFKEELEDEALQKDDEVYAFLYARPQDVSVMLVNAEVTEEGATPVNSTLKIEAKVNVRYVAERSMQAEIYTDAFSMTNKTNLVSGTFQTAKPTRLEKFGATIDGQTVIGDDEPRIAKVCAVTNEHLLVANSTVQDGELTVEGVAYATIIYLTDDDVPTTNSLDIEIPFSNKFEVGNEFDGGIFVTSDITDVDAKVKKGKEVNVSLDVCFWVFEYDTETQVALKDIELTEQLPKSEYSLEMYIAPKGSTLWDVLKHMLVTEDVLMTQNPELVFPLENTKTIVHFRQNI